MKYESGNHRTAFSWEDDNFQRADTRKAAATGAASGRKLEPNVGIAKVPDARLDFLSSKFNPEKTTYATVEFVDIQGLVRGKGQDMALAPRADSGRAGACCTCV